METITITKEEYLELVKKAERIEAVKRMFARERYVSEEDIKVVLDIEEEEGEDGSI